MHPVRTALPRRDGAPEPLPEPELSTLVRRALEEDLGGELDVARDLTTAACEVGTERASAQLVAREGGCLAGLEVFLSAFRWLDPAAALEVHRGDGDTFEAGD
ncbi:MAG: hypothetical protein MK291_01900, partial [Planctomycetes bacterium]|nr:hypothetical protein [Planctomycetota bacterium]